MTQQNANTCAEEYVVKRGDSFYLIAHKLGVPLRDLLAANRDIHPARLMVGDVLCVPREEDDSPQNGGLSGTGSAGTTGGSAGTTGDSAGTSSDSAGTESPSTDSSTGSESTDSSSNPTQTTRPDTGSGTAPDTSIDCPETEQYTVERGQTVADLQLQGLVSRHTLETANPGVDLEQLRVGQTVCIPKENVPCALPETYTMGSGETLESVAVRFNLPVASLLRANPCLAPQDFEQGTIVVLPR